jgi:type IV pilus assembly protein PilA
MRLLHLCVAAVLVPSLVMACGVKKYISASKQAEAKHNLLQIGRNARVAYDTERVPEVLEPSAAQTSFRSLCASATNMVPASAADIQGRKYMSAPSDWAGSATAGWKCLRFTIDVPQYYQYGYTASGASNPGDSFSAVAHGDLNGDGKLSTFEVTGKLDASKELVVSATIKEINPDE